MQAPLGAPGQVAAQIRVGVITGGALEPGQVGSYGKPQRVGMRYVTAGRDKANSL
jgi:hypothetical protein